MFVPGSLCLAGSAAAPAPLGGDDGGFVPPSSAALSCAGTLSKLYARGTCPQCLIDHTANLGDDIEAARDADNGAVFCVGTVPLGDVDTGNVAPDPATLKCELVVAKNAYKLRYCIAKCHYKYAKHASKGLGFDDEACESGDPLRSCLAKYNKVRDRYLPLCPPCLDSTAQDALAAAAEADLDAGLASFFCAAARDPDAARLGGIPRPPAGDRLPRVTRIGSAVMRTPLTDRLAVDHPIVQAGMGTEAGARLAAAVSDAGALGTIGSIGSTPDRLLAEIRACRAATARPFAVNVVTWPWAPWALDLLDVVLAERPPIVTLSFGDPLPHLARCRAAGLRTIVQVQDVDGARAALAARPDAVIAQGNEAGGHTGRRGTLSFAAQVLDVAGDVPVLVAGGIGSGRGIAAALAMGAAGAVLGTRFKASAEFEAAAGLKEAIVASDGCDTLHDEIFDDACGLDWPRGVTGRALRNRFSAEWAGRREALRARVATYPLFGFMAELMGDPATTINWAGESAGLVDRVRPAAEIVRALVDETDAHLRAAARLLARGRA